MLLQLHVEDFALIDRMSLRLGEGLNILTGETGAGKSLIIDAMTLIFGGRGSGEYVRTGRERALIEAVFDVSGNPAAREKLAALGLGSGDDVVILSREIAPSGKSSCRVNGRPVTASILKEVGECLADIHGQHEHQSLLHEERHVDLLDSFGGPEIGTLRERVRCLHQRLEEIQARLQELVPDERDRARKIDLLLFQVREIDAARLRPGEEEELCAERLVLANAERLFTAAGRGYALLYEGGQRERAVFDLLGQVCVELRDCAKLDPALAGIAGILDTAMVHIDDACRELRAYRDRIQFNPARLEEIERRLDLLSQLKRKYGRDVADMLRYREEVAAQLDLLEHSEEAIAAAKREMSVVRGELGEVAARLSLLRQKTAALLEGRVAAELADLGMPQTVFKVDFRVEADPEGIELGGSKVAVGAKGADRVEFLLSPNPGEPLRPLARIASGGEMSRIMLALKTILAEVDGIPTLIFDEIDTGIGGKAAQAIGEKLAVVAAVRQVVCVTHLPQIACMADNHCAIYKEVNRGRTATRVRTVEGEEKVGEVARMLGGSEVTEITVQHAREMLNTAGELRKKLPARRTDA